MNSLLWRGRLRDLLKVWKEVQCVILARVRGQPEETKYRENDGK
jgi:hypothetical protein